MLYGDELARALTEAILKKGVTDSEVARAFGVKPPSVFEWKRHGRIHKRHIPKLLSYFQDVVVPEHWGLDSQPEVKAGYVSFDLLDTVASAGVGALAFDTPEVIQQVNVLESWASRELGGDLSRIKLITARGDSMSGTIEDRDVLFVDSSIKEYIGEGIYVIAAGGEVQVKRLQRLISGGFRIISDNATRYPAQDVMQEAALAELRVCGRVLAIWNLKKVS